MFFTDFCWFCGPSLPIADLYPEAPLFLPIYISGFVPWRIEPLAAPSGWGRLLRIAELYLSFAETN